MWIIFQFKGKKMLIPPPDSWLKIRFIAGLETLSFKLHFQAKDGQDVVDLLLIVTASVTE